MNYKKSLTVNSFVKKHKNQQFFESVFSGIISVAANVRLKCQKHKNIAARKVTLTSGVCFDVWHTFCLFSAG